jgi:hypothetical protein
MFSGIQSVQSKSATNHRSLVVILCSSEQLPAGRLLLRELRAKLERLADHEKRTVSDYVEKVLREHVELTSAYVQHADKTKRSASAPVAAITFST